MPVIISFASQKGGVGKSTLARALLAVAAHVMKVRLADLDPDQASVVFWERIRRRNDAGPPCEVIGYDTLADVLADSFDVDLDLLIIDTPAGTNRATLEIAQHSHLVVQLAGASADDLRPAILTFHELVKAGIPKERLALAACRVLTQKEADVVRAYVQDAGYEVLPGAIYERAAYREAQNRGRSITETTVEKLNAQADDLLEGLLIKVTKEIDRQQAKEAG